MRKMSCLKSDYIASDLKIIIIVFHAGGSYFALVEYKVWMYVLDVLSFQLEGT